MAIPITLSLAGAYTYISATAAVLMAVTTGATFAKGGWQNPFKKPPKGVEKLPKQLFSIWLLDIAARIFKFIAAVIYAICNMGARFFGLLHDPTFRFVFAVAVAAIGTLYIYVSKIPNRKKRMESAFLMTLILLMSVQLCTYLYLKSDFSDAQLYHFHKKEKKMQEKLDHHNIINLNK